MLDEIDGYRTYIGGIGAILIGAGRMMYDWYNGAMSSDPYTDYMFWFVAGWSIIFGRKAIAKIE